MWLDWYDGCHLTAAWEFKKVSFPYLKIDFPFRKSSKLFSIWDLWYGQKRFLEGKTLGSSIWNFFFIWEKRKCNMANFNFLMWKFFMKFFNNKKAILTTWNIYQRRLVSSQVWSFYFLFFLVYLFLFYFTRLL